MGRPCAQRQFDEPCFVICVVRWLRQSMNPFLLSNSLCAGKDNRLLITHLFLSASECGTHASSSSAQPIIRFALDATRGGERGAPTTFSSSAPTAPTPPTSAVLALTTNEVSAASPPPGAAVV